MLFARQSFSNKKMPTNFFEWVIFLIQKNYKFFITGTKNTLIMAIIGTIVGFIIGLLVAIVKTIPISEKSSIPTKILFGSIKALLTSYIEIFRGTPMIVQASVIFYGLIMAGVSINRMFAAILIISINTGAYMAEIIRGGIISVDKGQTEGAHSIGMSHFQTMRCVVLPQAVRNIMPSIGNEFVVNIKDSSVLNVIAVTELYFMGVQAAGTYYRFFEVYFIIAIIYFILTFTVTRILRWLEKKMDGPDSYTILGSQTDSKSQIRTGGNA